MDEIKYKLQSKDPALISHALSKLLELIKKQVDDSEIKDASKVSNFKLLLSKCESADPVLLTSTFQALVSLVESGLWPAASALSTFTSYLYTTKNFAAITIGISQLLVLDIKFRVTKGKYVCPFMLQVPQHPFITILNQEGHSWQIILNQMKFIMYHHDQEIVDNNVNALRPVFLYILCDPSLHLSDGCKHQTWQLLINSSFTSELLSEILLWLRYNQVNTCLDVNHRVLEFAEVCISKKSKAYCTGLIPLIASLSIRLIECGYDPRSNFTAISSMIDLCENGAGNITLALMTEIVLICPATYLFGVLQICNIVIEKMPCNSILSHTLVACILKWMAYPSVLCSEALTLAREMINKIISKKERSNNNITTSSRMMNFFSHSDSTIRFYMEMICCISTWTEENIFAWLKKISKASVDLRYKCRLTLCGLFLQTNRLQLTKEIADILIQLAKEVNFFASHVLSLILYKLTKCRDYAESKHLLLAIPELLIVKENTPIVIHTLETLLKSDKPLKYFAIELYLKAMQNDPRCYRFLSNALLQRIKDDHSWYSDVTCAKAIRFICENRCEHAEELVPLISQILNRCVDVNGSTASALAIKSISALCKAAVIGICSTWQVLAPKMKNEKRTIVLESLCDLFKEVPFYPARPGEEYDKLIADVITTLWKFVSSADTKVSECALKALASYHLGQISLKALPEEFRRGLVLPQAYATTPIDAARKPEDVLPYVPGTCWIQMLRNVNKTILSAAGDLLISYIKNEVSGFRSQMYLWPQGEPQNFKYLPEKSVIRTVGEYLRRNNKSDSNNERIIVECLRIFAYKYPKPLPNIKWDFLQDTVTISNKAKEYTLSIACHHAKTSLSARTFLENYLASYKPSISSLNSDTQSGEYLTLYANLEDLCESIPPNTLKSFLEITLDHVLENMSYDDEKSTNLFNVIMSSYARTIKSEIVHDANRSLLSVTLEKLIDKIDLTCERYESYFTAISELSIKQIVDSMTSPSVWWETTTDKLKNAIAIRARLARTSIHDSPLSWMNELIDASFSTPRTGNYLLEVMQELQVRMRSETSSAEWILDFMTTIQDFMTESSKKDKAIFYCNILFVSVICLSGIECLLTDKDALTSSQEVRSRLFPQAIAILAEKQEWKNIIPQVMEWLNHMRVSYLSEVYRSAFHSSLVTLRYEQYYNDAWMKYLSVKTVIRV